ncbi:MAG: glutamine synthetase [Omnitrophica WOR_2 bacterium RIFCSPLOWO2_12_FULL_46_30]|nr:MAG: glutamine synthetase [Omnitrophica WOR_2 bacterium RIFCSPHIGHO2_02_FULL_46_37]OGX44237.1 MAG: glutamine synthetase [Omnitrophica WOR_2 bacterium RIFCSPLOWO2_02_FULL_45_28]OGX52390.1 MAG: glutamine synthetase [Omnitrophica WOR_2 bacterium RIFCSPLOWO2_12_FULL_46_30]
MVKKTKQDILKLVKQHKVKFIRLWFTDVLGFLKGFAITPDELEGALEEGMGFDGSSIEGFARIEESDMIARPDPHTFAILPWRSGQDYSVARMFCDIYEPNGRPFEGDPRYVLKRNLAKAKQKGFTYNVGPELEFFYFKDAQTTLPLDQGGYFDLVPLDVAQDLRRDTIFTLQALGIQVEYSHHEVAPSQHEIDLRYADVLTMADNVMTYRLVVKEIARQHGVYATFMPKPLFGINGSGMHVHQSLFKGDKNAFFDKNDKYHLSGLARSYTAGLLKHAPEITAITSQWVNSYKRLVPGYEAPVYICWAQMNRSALIRIPMYKPGKEKATRIEYRSPDPACNPYLAFSVMLACGLAGIEKNYKLPEPASDNIYHMSEEEKTKAGIKSLPDDLLEAIRLSEDSSLVKECLGARVFEYFIRNKKMEWNEYKAQVSEYEVKKYLPIL